MADWLATDDLTVVLGLLLGAVVLLGNLFKPQSLVHPILLGRQSDVDRVRKKGESAVYRNYSTGLVGRLPMRPANDIRLLSDLVKSDFETPRTLWSTKVTNAQLKARVSALAKGLMNKAGLVPRESNTLLLLNDSLEFLIADLALSSISVPTFTLSAPSLLSQALETHPPDVIIVQSQYLASLLELILDDHQASNHTLIVVGEEGLPKHLEEIQKTVRIHLWVDLEGEGRKLANLDVAAPQPDDVFTVSIYPGPQGGLRAAEFTHLNMTAGVTCVRGVLNAALTSADTVLSAHTLTTGYGRAIAYTALYEGANFATFPTSEGETSRIATILDTSLRELPSPTVFFLATEGVQTLTAQIMASANHSLAFPLSWRHKLSALQKGFISNDTVWDKLSFAKARAAVLGRAGNTLKNVVVDGTLEAAASTLMRVALSLPFSHVYTDSCVAGPVMSSHMLDLQAFPVIEDDRVNTEGSFGSMAHVGPPTINIEVKLVGVNDAAVEAGASPVGAIVARGPPVGRPVDEEELPDQWVRLSGHASVQANGTFKVVLI